MGNLISFYDAFSNCNTPPSSPSSTHTQKKSVIKTMGNIYYESGEYLISRRKQIKFLIYYTVTITILITILFVKYDEIIQKVYGEHVQSY